MSKKNIVIIGVAGLIGLVFLFVIYNLVAQKPNTIIPELTRLQKGDHVKWSKDSKNMLVEFSDFQCPACKIYYDTLNTFEASGSPNIAITRKTSLVFKHFPLYQIHENAFELAYAVEAAANQGKFFEMSDIVFKNQLELDKATNKTTFIEKLAKEIGLDTIRFNNDRSSKAVQDKVQNDLSMGEKIGINSTPTFYLNGKKLDITSPNELITILKELR